MRRLLALLLAGCVIVVAARLPAPPVLDAMTGTLVDVEEAAFGSSRFVHCPWALSDGRRESVYVVASDRSTGFDISFLEGGKIEQVRSGEVTREAMARIENPREIGTSSALVEFAESPGSVGVVAFGEELLAGDLCTATLPATWHLPGGSTIEGERLTLRLFNPFTSDARVDLWALSELGTEAGESLEGLTVPAHRTRVIALDEILTGRESLAIIVRPSLGAVIPVMILDTGSDIAVWPGMGSSEGWEFPVAAVDGYDTELVLTNEASLEVNYLVEVFDETAALLEPLSGTIDGPGQARVRLGEFPTSRFGIRVTGDGPFGAVVVGRSGTAVAATAGTPTTGSAWLVPGPGAVPAVSRLRLLNAGVLDLEVAYVTLTPSGEGPPGSVALAAGAVETVTVDGTDVAGVFVSANGAFSVGWWAEGEGTAVFGGAVPVER